MLCLAVTACASQALAQCGIISTVSPVNGATVTRNAQNTVQVKWNAVSGAASYDVYFGPQGQGCSTVHATETSTSWAPPSSELTAGATYEWRVVANGVQACQTPPTSTCSKFTLAGCPNAPALNAPVNGANVAPGTITLQWNAVSGADSYEVFGGIDNEPVTSRGTTTSTSKTVFVEAGHTVQWYVVSRAPGCTGAQSATFVFHTTCPTVGPTLVNPLSNASTTAGSVTFSWSAVAGASSYELRINGNAVAPNLTTTSYTANLPAGTYQWQVRAKFSSASCPATESETRALTLTAACPANPAKATLIAPANGATNLTSPVTFQWNAVPNATAYRVLVSFNDQQSILGTTSNTSLTATVPAGTGFWSVQALFGDGCPTTLSDRRAFTVAAPVNCDNATLTLSAPAPDAVLSSPVHLVWSAVANATSYRVWTSIDGGAPVNIARTTTTDVTLSLPAGKILWYVEALRERCDPVVSNKATFTVTKSATCNNAAPVLVSPLGTRTSPAHATEHVTLTWNAVANAIGYRLWIGRNGDAYGDVKLTKDTHADLDLESGVYGWYVQALFEGCPSMPSEPAFFLIGKTANQCPTAAPALLAPAAGSTTASPVTFSWTAIAGAEKYRLYAALNDGERQLLGTTSDTQLTRTLPPGTITWVVEAVFEQCASTFSQRSTFTVPRAQNCSTTGPQLLSPANEATVPAGTIDFVWNPVEGAVKYVLFAQNNDGATTALASTIDTHAVVENIPAGSIEWWVTAYFADCEPVQSTHFHLTTTRVQNCETRKPILLLPSHRVTAPVRFQWTAVPRAKGYKVWVAQGEQAAAVVASSTEPHVELTLAPGRYEWYVEATFENCPSTQSARDEFLVTQPVPCGTPAAAEAQVIGQALSNTDYRVRWNRLPNVRLYEVQESTSPNFENAQTFTTSETSLKFSHEVNGEPVQYLYRVRGISECNDDRGPYSRPVGVFIIAPRTNNASTEIGSEGNVVQKVVLPGSPTPLHFVATADKPWLTVTPSSGTLGAEGVTLTVTADATALLLGTNTGTINVQYSAPASAGSARTNGTTTSTIPLSVSLVTPVMPTGKGTPPPDALIFPIVGHARGANDSLFESDVRIANLTAKTQKYELYFTPSGVDGTETSAASTVEISPNGTLAMDDIIASLFGTGTTSSATGMLEVRPLATSSTVADPFFASLTASAIRQLNTAASSRTYNFTPTGTFGQFIPAVRFADFIGKLAPDVRAQILSLQQVSQSSAYRANFGFAEGSGQAADLIVRVYDAASQLLATIPVSLQASEHKQINGMLAANGINDLQDGRVEVEVIGGGGKVTAYVSEVDNLTNDPLLVSPVVKGATTASRYVVPGTAYLNTGSAFWVTDLRVFNSGAAATPATVTFYPQGNPGAAVTRELTIGAGEIKVLDNVIATLFGQPNGAGGMVAIATPNATSLTATARTYNKTDHGTYGQFIPGVTAAESAGVEDRALQLLQLEQSSRFRTNIGLAETSGQPATVEVRAITPDSAASPMVTIDLAPNEFRQFSLGDFGLSSVYNARVTVKVVGGTGRVTAYGSAIDQVTQDPTYVPAQ